MEHDHRLLDGSDPLDQDPVVEIGTRQLDDVDAEFVAQRDRFFVERRRHRNAAGLAYGAHQAGVVCFFEAGIERLLDVADIVTLAEILVNEGIHIAQLDLDGGTHVVEADDAREVGDDAQAALEPPPMVIGKFENEEVFKYLI